jgi:hypothetical protein
MSKMNSEVTFSRDKLPEHEDMPPPSVAEFKNAWKCVSKFARALIQ